MVDDDERDDVNEGSVQPLVAGRYRLVDRIGRGGMAEVWRAEDVRLARTVAVKFLTLRARDESDERVIARFLREARIAAAVRHPNVVDILDFGTELRRGASERPFMVMELLEGESLEDRLRRRPAITLEELVTIALGVLDGLDAVHRAGIVHRDLKPDNIFLLSRDGATHPKIIDFGVSRAIDEGQRRSVLTTVEGHMVGTPEYMSPEQARGRRGVDHRTDLYSVGVILYEALSGVLPYDAEGVGDLIIAIAMGGALPLSQLRANVGEPISDVVLRAMEVEASDRFQSARTMHDALLEASGSLGHEARGSLPSPMLARHASPTGAIASPALESRMETHIPGFDAPARSANGTPQAWTVGPEPKPRRSAWRAAAAAAVVVAAAGLGTFAWLRPTDPTLPSTASGPSALPSGGGPTAGAARSPSPASTASTASAAAPTPEPTTQAPALEPSVRVLLSGLPVDAEVSVDDAPATVEDGALHLPRDGASHRIDVQIGNRSWQATHVADADGSYEVRLPRAPATRRGRARRSARSDGDDVFRELDY